MALMTSDVWNEYDKRTTNNETRQQHRETLEEPKQGGKPTDGVFETDLIAGKSE